MARNTSAAPSGLPLAAPSGSSLAAPSGPSVSSSVAPSGPQSSSVGPSGQPSAAPSGNKKRTLVVDDEGFQQYTKKKRTSNTNTDTTNTTSTFPKFKIIANNAHEGYKQLADFEKHNASLSFLAKPNIRGEWIITPKNKLTYDRIRTTKHLNTQELSLTDKHTKAVISSYPLALPLDPLLTLTNIHTAQRMRNKIGLETQSILVTFIGNIPDRVHLGVWGSFRTATYNPEPLRCYRCQRYGHHKNQCTTEVRCAVCSGRHDTQVCLNKHKQGGVTTARCPNCAGNHHAWYNRCPARLGRIKQDRPSQKQNQPRRPPLLPTPVNPWFRQPPASLGAAPNTPNTFYTPIATPNTRDFPPLQPSRPHQPPPRQPSRPFQPPPVQPPPLPQRSHKQRRRHQQPTQPQHTVTAPSTPTVTTPTKSTHPHIHSTPEKQTTLTLTKQDLTELMQQFINTVFHATNTSVPQHRIDASLETLVRSAERRARAHTSSSISMLETSLDELVRSVERRNNTEQTHTDTPLDCPLSNPIPIMPPLSPLRNTPPHPHMNPKDPRNRVRTRTT